MRPYAGRVVLLWIVLSIAASAPSSAGSDVRAGAFHVDGEPFFPFGVWWADSTDIEAAAAFGLNVVYPDPRPLVSLAAERGLKAIGNVRAGARGQDDDAIIGWFVRDDASTPEHVADIRSWTTKLRRMDDRPTIVSCNSRDPEVDGAFAEVADVYAPYQYPFPRFTIDAYESLLRRLRDATRPTPMWTTVQSSGMYSHHRVLGFDDRDMLGMLDPGQLRLLVWTAVRAGARGILLWPANGLFVREGWNVTRAHEAAILAAEIRAVGSALVRGVESPDARTSTSLARVTRVDDAERTLLILTRSGPGLEYAVDHDPLDVTIALTAPPDAHAIEIRFPRAAPLDVRRDGQTLHVSLRNFDLTALVLVSPSSASLDAVCNAVERDRDRVALHACELARGYRRDARRVLESLSRLGARPPSVPSDWADAEPRLSDLEGDDPVLRHEAANAIVAYYRALLFDCRAYADRFIAHADPDALYARMSAFTLPTFFSSFDIEMAVGGANAP